MSDKSERINELATDILNLSRNTLVINLRFMDKAISMLELEKVAELDGMAVDGKKIYYDPAYTLLTFSKEKKQVTRHFMHMVLHCVFKHFWVGTLVDEDYWDLACDIAVENTINDLGFDILETYKSQKQLEEIGTLQKKVKYMTADMLYRYFMSASMSEKEISRLKNIFSADDHKVWYIPNCMEMQVRRNVGISTGGTATDGTADTPYHLECLSTVKSAENLVREWDDTARRIQMDITSFSKGIGKNKGSLVQNLHAVTRERYDYSSFLKKFAVLGERMQVSDDEFDYVFYTYGLTLYDRMPLIEPLEYKETRQIKDFVVAIDTSGSTSGELVQKFLQKTYNILKNAESFSQRFNLHIIQCDAEIQEDAKITSQEEFDSYIQGMKIRGLGGTDFRPVFNYVEGLIENGELVNLKGMIYFTDGYGTFPAKQPAYDTAFVFIEDGYMIPEVPVWAIKLVLQSDEVEEM